MPVDPQSVTLPITDIVVGANIKNIRTVFDEAAIKELAQSIYAEGLLVPLLITESEDAAGAEIFELVAGARRLRAIQYLLTEIDPDWSCSGEAEEVRCSVYAGSIEDAAVLTGVENIEREEVDDVDIGDWLHSMIEENGWTQADLGKKMKKSSGWISSHVTFAERASDELKKALREKVLRFSTACELAKTLSHEDQDKRVSRARQRGEADPGGGQNREGQGPRRRTLQEEAGHHARLRRRAHRRPAQAARSRRVHGPPLD